LLHWVGYILAFTKVLTIYQIYHISNRHFHPSPLFPLPRSWNSFNRYQFFILHTCVHSIFTILTLPFPFPTSSPLPLLPIPGGLGLQQVPSENSHSLLQRGLSRYGLWTPQTNWV
jgi:hypothetical protein